MAHYGILRDYQFAEMGDADDVRGAELYGLNGDKLGKIDDVIFDHATGEIRFVVVDTGGWLRSKKFIVPAAEVRPSTEHRDDFAVALTKQQIERLAPYNEKDVESEEKWADYERRYRSDWETGPIMHRAATDRNITPTTKQQLDAGSGVLPTAEEDTGTSVVPMRTESFMQVGPSGPSQRWVTFEDRLRQRRSEITSTCMLCRVEPAETASERERDEHRKAS